MLIYHLEKCSSIPDGREYQLVPIACAEVTALFPYLSPNQSKIGPRQIVPQTGWPPIQAMGELEVVAIPPKMQWLDGINTQIVH